MPAGFQVFDQFGNLRVDGTRRLLRYVGMVFTSGAAGAIANDGLLTGTPYPSAHMIAAGGSSWPGNNTIPPDIFFSGNVMSWSVHNAPHRIMMWVY